MAAPTFPPSHDPAENRIKQQAGYVEYAVFSGQRAGYFCGTCPAFRSVAIGQAGFCVGLKVPVVTYGCCNNWRIAPRSHWIGADGEPV